MNAERRLFEMIGLYFVHWSSFELTLKVAIWKLSDKTATDCVRASKGMNIPQLLASLQKLLDEAELQQRDSIIERLDLARVESVRNAIAHSTMKFGANELIFIAPFARKDRRYLRFTGEEFAKHLGEVSDRAHQLAQELGVTGHEEEYVSALEAIAKAQ